MRKKISIAIIFLIGFVLMLNLYKVQAYSGELDPENYITFPDEISIKNNIGTGTVTLSSAASGYNISYQKIDVTKEKYDKIIAKMNEHNSYVDTAQKTINEKEANLTALQKKQQDLQKDETATEEQIATAKANYDEEYAKYKEYYENAKTQEEKLKKEYLALIPDYTSSWKTAKNTSNNIVLDFSNYNGTAYFVLWVKISNGTNTYYDVAYYSPEIKTTENGNSNGGNSGTGTGTNSGSETTEGNWTDFSKAKFELKKEGNSHAIVEISGVTPKEHSTYYLLVTSAGSKPNVSEYTSEKIVLSYDKDTKTFKTIDKYSVAYYVELNQDLYVSVLEQTGENSNIVSFGNKLTRFSEPKYSDAFYATFITSDSDQIVTNFTHNGKNNRKIQIKIGKITDISILKKIKNKNSIGFEELLNYAKSNSGIYDQILYADKDSSFDIEYNAPSNNSLINLKGLENDAYYFLYIKTDDENGKYVSNEAVTLAQASVPGERWALFFYGTSDFKWSEWGTDDSDNTIAPDKLPNTGAVSIVIATLTITTGGIIAYKKYKKYNF